MNRTATVTTLKSAAQDPSEVQVDWPTLHRMGVMRPQEISHYTLRQDARSDTLRIHYKRAKGSLLPVTRRYQFGRSIKTIVADGGTARFEDTYEISPHLLGAIDELDALVARNRLGTSERAEMPEIKQELLDELETLRKQTMRQLDPSAAGTLSVQFDRIARRVEAL